MSTVVEPPPAAAGMTQTMTVSVTREPAGYHPDGETWFGVSLAFDRAADDSWRDEFVKWLVTARTWHAYSAAETDTAAKKLEKVTLSVLPGPWDSGETNCSAEALADWLIKRQPADESPTRGASQSNPVIEAATARRVHLQQAAVAWNAPVPQWAGLAGLLKLELTPGGSFPPNTRIFLLPLPDGTDPPLEIAIEDGRATIVTDGLTIYVSPADPPPAAPRERSATAFLTLPQNPSEVRRFSEAIDRHAALLVNTHAVFMDALAAYLPKPGEAPSGDQLGALNSIGWVLAHDPLRLALLSSSIPNWDASPAQRKLVTRDGCVLAPLFQRYDADEQAQLSVRGRVHDAITAWDYWSTKKAFDGKYSDEKGPKTVSELLSIQRDLAHRLSSEGGIEDVISSLLTHLSDKRDDDNFKSAIEGYRNLVRGDFNGLEAVRQEVAYLLQVLSAPKKDVTRDDPTRSWKTRLQDAHFWAVRFGGEGDGGCLKQLTNALGTVSLGALSGHVLEYVQGAWPRSVDRMWPDHPDESRFQPDSSPSPLTIRIASTPQADTDGDGVDDYTQDYNGIGVVIRRCADNEKASRWAHASLVKMAVDTVAAGFPVAIQPFLPVASDGRRPIDIPYIGYPLGSPAPMETDAPNVQRQASPTDDLAFYAVGDVDYTGEQAQPFQRPPRLAYGCRYEWAAYHVTKAGSLPTMLQSSSDTPWMPKADVTLENGTLPDSIAAETYRRRTAISGATFAMQQGQPARIGKRYPDVEPLALDRPRLCITPTGFIDLFRRTDGKGELPSKAIARFDDCRVYGADSATLHVEVHSAGNAACDAEPIGVHTIAAEPSPRDDSMEVSLPEDAGKRYWLRLRVSAQDGRTPASISCALPAVTAVDGSLLPVGHPGNHAEPAVLVVAPETKDWVTEATQPALIECVLPSVSYFDWEHWIGNRKLPVYGGERSSEFAKADSTMLLASLAGVVDESGAIGRDVQKLPDPAVIGYLVELAAVDDMGNAARTGFAPLVITVKRGKDLADAMTRSAVQVDDNASIAFNKLKTTFDSVSKANRIRFTVKTDNNITLTTDRDDSSNVTVTVPPGMVAMLAVRPIVAEHSVAVDDEDRTEGAIHAGLRQWAAGKTMFDGVVGLVFPGAELLIEAACKIPDGFEAYPQFMETVTVVPGGPSRRYDLTIGHSFSQLPWSPLFAHVDVDTQRWRDSGRPLYSFYRPEHDGNASVVSINGEHDRAAASVPSAASESSPPWLPFEQELFFDRDHADCDTRRARIGVGGGAIGTSDDGKAGPRTLLQTIRWEEPSATWFRHAFTFISRYRGLLRAGAKGDHLGPPQGSERWSRRIAVLADPARLKLTRPQVRCHVPLASSPDPRARPGETPPIACVLEEPPFAVGGLAERMLPEIAVKPGYAFLGESDGGKLGPLDLGREIGRDPRIESWSWIPHRDPANPDSEDATVDDPTTRLAIASEGPVGLHFEQASSPAPAWVNCQYLLRPVSLDDTTYVPDETFVGLRMRRALDPAWVAGNAWGDEYRGTTQVQAPETTRWIEWRLADLPTSTALFALKISKDGTQTCYDICRYCCTADSSEGALLITRCLVDSEGGDGDVVLCRIPSKRFERLVLLHSGDGDGRHVLSLLGIPTEPIIKQGQSNAPVALVSIPWAVPKDSKTIGIAVGGTPLADLPLLSSEPTFLEWARTARDGATMYAVTESEATFAGDESKRPQGIHERTRPFQPARSARPLATADLRATVKQRNDHAALAFHEKNSQAASWIVPPVATSPQALGCQRHMVGIFTTQSAEPGRRFERFHSICRLFGNPILIPSNSAEATAVRIAECEIPAVVVRSTTKGPSRIPLSCQGQPALPDGDYRLHLRFANSPDSMTKRGSVTVTVTLGPPADGKPPTTVAFVHDAAAIRTLDIVWRVQIGSPQNACARWLTAPIGKPPAFDQPSATPWTRSAESPSGVMVSLTSEHEIEADVSLLYSPPVASNNGVEARSPEFIAFDFNWLFTPQGENDNDVSQRISPETLTSLTDAQFRIIAVSPPIPVRLVNG